MLSTVDAALYPIQSVCRLADEAASHYEVREFSQAMRVLIDIASAQRCRIKGVGCFLRGIESQCDACREVSRLSIAENLQPLCGFETIVPTKIG